MATPAKSQNKIPKDAPKEKSLIEKFLEEKKTAALGGMSVHQMGNKNPIFNNPGFGGKSGGGGRPTIRKHAARSR